MGIWIELIAAMGGWATVVVAVSTYLHTRRTTVLKDLIDKFEMEVKTQRLAHESMRIQMSDMARSFAENYVRKTDLDTALRNLGLQIVETRKDIGSIGNRIDDLVQSTIFTRRDYNG